MNYLPLIGAAILILASIFTIVFLAHKYMKARESNAVLEGEKKLLENKLELQEKAYKAIADEREKTFESQRKQMEDSFKLLSEQNSAGLRRQSAETITELLKPIQDKFDLFDRTMRESQVKDGERSSAMMEAVKQNNRIFRLNTWFRFTDTFYGLGTPVEPLKKLVDSGMLGWPLKVTVSGATGFTWKFFWVGKENLQPEPVPANLDYDMWLGPAPFKPYNLHRTHQTFRGYWDYDGGGLGDMGQHYLDPVQYILGKDNTSPVKVEVDAPQQHPDAIGIWRKITYTYADGCQIVLEGEGFESGDNVPYIEGPLGKVYKGFQCTIPDVMNKLAELPDPAPQNTDFINCIKTRQKFALNEQNGFRSATIVNMAVCALRLNRTLNFDPDKLQFIGDDAANALIDQPMRAPWRI